MKKGMPDLAFYQAFEVLDHHMELTNERFHGKRVRLDAIDEMNIKYRLPRMPLVIKINHTGEEIICKNDLRLDINRLEKENDWFLYFEKIEYKDGKIIITMKDGPMNGQGVFR